MPVDLHRILQDPPDDDGFWKELLAEADVHAATQRMHARALAGQVYAAKVMKQSSAALVAQLDRTTGVLAMALTSHEVALKTAAEASTLQSKGLKCATWALVLATLGLVVATIVGR
jgi:hypothetical protein